MFYAGLVGLRLGVFVCQRRRRFGIFALGALSLIRKHSTAYAAYWCWRVGGQLPTLVLIYCHHHWC